MNGTNHFPSADNAITVGFRVKKDSWNANHGELMELVQYLPTILEKIMYKYRRHYFHSGNFHVNIDTKAPTKEDAILLVISDKESGKTNDCPDKTDIISLKRLEEEYSYKSWSPQATTEEESFSEDMKSDYRKKYNNYDIDKNYFVEGAWF